MVMDLEKEVATFAMTSKEREGGGGRHNAWNQYSYLSLSRPTHVSYSSHSFIAMLGGILGNTNIP